jgi:hypothetical protein
MAGLLKMAGIFILRGAGGDQHERLLYPTFRPLVTNSVNLGHLAKMPPWTLLIMMTVST